MSGEQHSTNAEKVQAILDKHIKRCIDDKQASLNSYTELLNMMEKDTEVKTVCW